MATIVTALVIFLQPLIKGLSCIHNSNKSFYFTFGDVLIAHFNRHVKLNLNGKIIEIFVYF